MSEDDALFRAVVAAPEDADARLVYADWLDDHDRPGGAYLRAEVAVAGGDADRRLELLRHFTKLPAAVRNRVTQPDFLLAPPAPFQLGWHEGGFSSTPTPYRTLPNLPTEAFSPRARWLTAATEPRPGRKQFERYENEAMREVLRGRAP